MNKVYIIVGAMGHRYERTEWLKSASLDFKLAQHECDYLNEMLSIEKENNENGGTYNWSVDGQNPYVIVECELK